MPRIPSQPRVSGEAKSAGIQQPDNRIADLPAKEPAVLSEVPADSIAAETLTEGTAQLSVALNSDQAIQAWEQAAKGSKIPLEPKPDNRLGHLGALMEHVKNAKTFSPEQKARVATFLREFAGHSARNPAEQTQALRRLNELLVHTGITQPQLQLIADGKFTAADLIMLLHSNPGTSLVGQTYSLEGIRTAVSNLHDTLVKPAVAPPSISDKLN